ncbi:MAG: hypothetical protein WC822_03585 [Candidatus Paceibacterota bacterium]|jgi:hypothetical protein
MKTFLNKFKSYFLAHKFLVISLLIIIAIALILWPTLFLAILFFFVASFKDALTSLSSFFYFVGQLVYLGLVIWAIVHIHKINSGPKTETTSKYPITQTTWFWWVIITFSYMFCIFSYDPQSNFNILSRLGGFFGLFTPIGPENFVLFSIVLLIVVLVVISKMEKKTRQIEKISARKKIMYSLYVLFILTFFVDLFGMFTSFGSYKYFVQYTILNHSTYMDLRNIQ